MSYKEYLKETLKSGKNEPHESSQEVQDGEVPQNEVRGFKYLDDLIHSGADEIVLDTDIAFTDDTVRWGVEITDRGIVIDGNGHTIDALGKSRIFTCTCRDVTIRNVTFKNGCAGLGGALMNYGKVEVIDSEFIDNTSEDDGGAVYNSDSGKMRIVDCRFESNESVKGGAICNAGRGRLSVTGCEFTKNRAENGGAIHNNDKLVISDSIFNLNEAKFAGTIANEGDLQIRNGEILSSNSINHAISNTSSLKVTGTEFRTNKSKHLIFSEGDEADLSVCRAKFIKNGVDAFIINSRGRFCSIRETLFEDNGSKIIFNKADMKLTAPEVTGDGQIVVNDGYLLVKGAPMDFEDLISGNGKYDIYEKEIGRDKSNFTYLDRKIRESDSGVIVLEEDIRFGRYEVDTYGRGILIDIDNLVIDGNGHSIDGADSAQFFRIFAENVTLKNITFKNGLSQSDPESSGHSEHAAIDIANGASAEIIDCTVTENRSLEDIGVIINRGVLKIADCEITKNTGRAITNRGVMKIHGSRLTDNRGGTISNYSKLSIRKSTFADNIAYERYNGAAIYNAGTLAIRNSGFYRNWVKNASGGAIYNLRTLFVSNSSFIGNELEGVGGGSGGAIFSNRFSDDLKIKKCDFIENRPNSVACLYETYVPRNETGVTDYGYDFRGLECSLEEFERMNDTTDSIFDLGDHEVLIVLDDGTNLTDWDDVENKSDVLYVSEDLSSIDNVTGRYEHLDGALIIAARNVTGRIKSTYNMFKGCNALVDVVGFDTWDTSGLETMENMFGGCHSLEGCGGLKDIDVSNVCNMTALFNFCRSLKDISFLKEWDVSGVTDMWSMFSDCRVLEDISPLREWDVSGVTDMRSMFSRCWALESLAGMESWDVSNVRNMGSLFWECNSLSDISALEDWDTSSLTGLSRAFWSCRVLEDISPLAGWNLSGVNDLVYCFLKCRSLNDLTPLAGWDVSNVEIMRSMFEGCSSLETLDGLGGWNPESATTLERMFADCMSLKDVSAVKSWNIPGHVTTGNIFDGCPEVTENPFKKITGDGEGPLNFIDLNFKFIEIYGAGWCKVRLGDIYSRASYITDVPGDCLDSMITALKFDMDFEVDFNAEGWEFEVCADSEQCYFNFYNGEHHTIDTMNKYDLAIVIAKNIRDDLGSWQRWSGKDLDSLLGELEHLISGPDEGEARNFTYLDKLLHGPSLEVVLDSDIVIDGGEEGEYTDGIELDVNGLVLDGNGHSIDAQKIARIFTCMDCSVTLKNLTLKGGDSSEWGGAIYLEDGNLRIVNCRFEDNSCYTDGGAISTSGGKLAVEKSEFCSNTSGGVGGAISLEDGTVLEISSSEFRDNTALRDGGGAIFNDWSVMKIFDSRFSKNRGTYGGAIFSNRELLLDGCGFASNDSRDKHCEDIDNKGILILRDSSFSDGGVTVSNGFHCYISGGDDDMVENRGRIFAAAEFSDDERDFTYLDDLIRKNPSEVTLDYDIRLDWENGEEKKFPEGILIDTDVVIDANGHSIDARGLVRAFKCCGDVTIRNARIINGFDEKGGAILNRKGDLTILESSFEENEAYYGGALYNDGVLAVKSSSFESNRVDSIHYSEGGAIFNNDELSVECSIFEDNLSENDGGAICNGGNADISESRFISNKAKYNGGAVHNDSKLDIADSTLMLNGARLGGAVFLSESAKYSSANCKFRDNEPDDVFEDKKEQN